MAVLIKATYNDLQALKTTIGGYDEDLDKMDKKFQDLLIMANQNFYIWP